MIDDPDLTQTEPESDDEPEFVDDFWENDDDEYPEDLSDDFRIPDSDKISKDNETT